LDVNRFGERFRDALGRLFRFFRDFWDVYVGSAACWTVPWLHFALVNPLVSALQAYPFSQDLFTKVTFRMFAINILCT
jgi:hypothetical protein